MFGAFQYLIPITVVTAGFPECEVVFIMNGDNLFERWTSVTRPILVKGDLFYGNE